jgi:type I restriction enzyme M protein
VEKSWWEKRAESEVAWKVKIADIAARGYDLDIKNPHREEAKVEYSSDELIEMLQTSFEKSSKLLQALKKDMA